MVRRRSARERMESLIPEWIRVFEPSSWPGATLEEQYREWRYTSAKFREATDLIKVDFDAWVWVVQKERTALAERTEKDAFFR